jgi:Arc/MetJ-type ribon-helix-helix transcriptional regulator
MKSIVVDLPDNLASTTEDYVNAGFFQSEAKEAQKVI